MDYNCLWTTPSRYRNAPVEMIADASQQVLTQMRTGPDPTDQVATIEESRARIALSD